MIALNSIHAAPQVKDPFSAPAVGVQTLCPLSTEFWEGKEERFGAGLGEGPAAKGQSPGLQVESPGSNNQ